MQKFLLRFEISHNSGLMVVAETVIDLGCWESWAWRGWW